MQVSLKTQIHHCDLSHSSMLKHLRVIYITHVCLFVCLFRHVEQPEHVLLLFTLHLKCCNLLTLPPLVTTRSRSYQGQQVYLTRNEILKTLEKPKVHDTRIFDTQISTFFLPSSVSVNQRQGLFKNDLLVINSIVTSVSTNLNCATSKDLQLLRRS